MKDEPTHDEPTQEETRQQARQEIQELVWRISQLSKQDLDVEEYFGQFLTAVIAALQAAGGAVWKRGDDGAPELICQNNLRTTAISDGGDDEARHRRLLEKVFATGESIIVPPYSGNNDAGNPTRFLLMLVPLRSEDASGAGPLAGVLEIFQRPGASIDVQRGYVTFLHGVCERAGDWMRRRTHRQLSREQSRWRQLDEFTQAIHESLNGRETAFAIANEGRLFIGCDRVCVAVRRGGSFPLEAVSGQDTVDRRSNLVVLSQKLVRRVIDAGDPFWYAGETDDLPPQIEGALEAYVDFAHSKTIGIIPLRRAKQPAANPNEEGEPERQIVGALVVEQIEDTSSLATVQQRAAQVAAHAERAITNAYDHDSLFLMPLWRLLGHSRALVTARNLPKTLTAAVALVIALGVCLLVPIRFELEGTAELQPVERRNVFASIGGVVEEVHVDTGDEVHIGDKLLTLRNTDLIVQIEDLQGRLSVASEQIFDYERRLLDGVAASPQEEGRWASELAGVRMQAANYTTQLKLLAARKEELTIRSPTRGEVITWDARRTLQNRPVGPGQVLLTVADTQGEWELLIHMPEDNIGYINDAQAKIQEDLEVSYILATDPGNKLIGDLRSVHLRAEPHETAGHSVKLVADIEETDLEHPRPGATATAQVHCGRRSIAFVWLHDVVEFIQKKVFF